jgi:hypothetical protein
MKTSFIKTILAVAAVSLLSVNVAIAGGHKGGGNGGGGGGNNGGNHSSGFKVSLGGGGGGGGGNKTISKSNNSSNGIARAIAIGAAINGLKNGNHNGNNGGQCHNNNGNCNNGGGYNGGGCNNGGGYGGDNYGQLNVDGNPNVGRAFEPFHSNYVVLPGDTFYEVSLKEYGLSANAKYIAQFNGMPQSAALTPGQILQLPSISASRRLSPSRAPIGESLQNSSTGSPVSNFTTSTGNVATTVSTATTTPAVEAPRPKVNVGTTLLVDGQSFGDQQGAARLRVGGAALKVEVVAWNGSSVKIRLPQLELDSSTNADIEVVRADGSLASKTGVELGSATEVASTR